MSNDLIPCTALPVLRSIDDYLRLGEVLAKSGFFADARDASKCVVKILAGAEMGFGPLASMADVHVIDGKPSIGAHLRAAAIKRSDRYDFSVVTLTREECVLEFFERKLPAGGQTRKGSAGWSSEGRIGMTLKEAMDCGLAMTADKTGSPLVKRNWRVTPDDMLFARCISKGYRRYCPDLTGGVLAYDPDELQQEPTVIETRVVSPASNGLPPAEPPKPAAAPAASPGEARISEAQVSELSSLLAATGVGVQALLDRYQVKGIVFVPACHFADAKTWLQSEAAKKMQPSTNHEGATISREQFDELAAGIRGVKSTGYSVRLCAALGVERLGLLPAGWFHLANSIIKADCEPAVWQHEKCEGKPFSQCDALRRGRLLLEANP